jgi:hexosaminidase
MKKSVILFIFFTIIIGNPAIMIGQEILNSQPTQLWIQGYSVIPTPRNVEYKGGEVLFSEDWGLGLEGLSNEDIAIDFLKMDLKEFHEIELKGKTNRVIRLMVKSGILKTGAEKAIEDQAYRLIIEPDKISVTGNTPHGLFYGVQTLLQLLKEKNDGRIFLPECTITDWPDSQLRILHWDTKNHQDRIETLKRYLDWAARFKINAISFEIWDKFTFPSHPVIGAPGAFTPEQIQEIVDYGLERHIQVIPNVQAPSHFIYVLKHPEFAYLRGGMRPLWEACTCDERLYDLIFDMYEDLINCTRGVDYFYASTDELFHAGSCSKCKRPFNPMNRSLAAVEFTNRADEFLRSKGRETIAWLEFPLLTEHVKLLNSEIIDGVGNGHLGWFADDDEFIKEENKKGIRLINYVAIQGGHKLFPSFFSYNGREGSLQSASQELSYGKARNGNFIGSFIAAWDDSGLHNETFWLGWAIGAQYSWAPGVTSVEQTVLEFMNIYYGTQVTNMVDVYKALQKGARFWEDSWDLVEVKDQTTADIDWGGKEYMSYLGVESGGYRKDYTLQIPSLPQLPNLAFEPAYSKKYADIIEKARGLSMENDLLMYRIQENILKAERNTYNLRVFLSLADFERHHIRLLLGLATAEDFLQQAHKAGKDCDAPLAMMHLKSAMDEIDRIIMDRETTYQRLKQIFEISRYPKGRSVDGKEFLYAESFYFADRRPDLSFMIAPEEGLELDKYKDKLEAIIREYGESNDLEGFYH